MDSQYILIAEGGGWFTHAIGPFDTAITAHSYKERDKWVDSWGFVSDELRDLPVVAPDEGILKEISDST